jgi:hypothetical protein
LGSSCSSHSGTKVIVSKSIHCVGKKREKSILNVVSLLIENVWGPYRRLASYSIYGGYDD